MSQYPLIIFDWDGTLMDSLARIVGCMQRAAMDLNIAPATEQQVHDIVGLALDIAIERLHPELSRDQIQLMRDRYAEHYISEESEPSPFYPGITDMLKSLHGKGVSLSVATGKSRKGLNRVFGAHNVAHWFHSSRCADETRSKPEPDMLLELLDYHQLAPEQAIMVGDTEFDLDMARRAGVDAVGVTWGAHDIKRLLQYQPKVCVNSVEELSRWLHR